MLTDTGKKREKITGIGPVPNVAQFFSAISQ